MKPCCMSFSSPPRGIESSKSWQPCRSQKSSKSTRTTLDHHTGRTERHSLSHRLELSVSTQQRKLCYQKSLRRHCCC